MKRFSRCLLLGVGLPLTAVAQTVGPVMPVNNPALAPNPAARNNVLSAPAPTVTGGTGTFAPGVGGTVFVPGDGVSATQTPGSIDDILGRPGVDSSVDAGTAVAQTTPGAIDNVLGTPGLNPGVDGNPNVFLTDSGVVDPRINNAMSAAPLAIAANATIMAFPASFGVQPEVLRTGSNGWTCLTDNPRTPGNDPMCVDLQWLNWLTAYLNQRTPAVTGPGIAYMLQGGSAASLIQPFAAQPAAGQTWVSLPPHIRVLSPMAWDPTAYPVDMGMNAAAPWVMFPNSVYTHLIVPLPLR